VHVGWRRGSAFRDVPRGLVAVQRFFDTEKAGPSPRRVTVALHRDGGGIYHVMGRMGDIENDVQTRAGFSAAWSQAFGQCLAR